MTIEIPEYLDRIGRGLMSNVKPVGGAVSERRIDYGPGYRIYFGAESDGDTTTVVILLRGGTKRDQSKDIALAKAYWKDYESRRRSGEI